MLFSVQKGLFFWSPLLLLAVAGLALLVADSARALSAAGRRRAGCGTYVIASWWDWQFGGSFGHRGFIDVYPIFGAGAGSASSNGRRGGDPAGGPWHVVVAVSLCVVQMLQSWNGILPMSDTTWAQYRGVFLHIR